MGAMVTYVRACLPEVATALAALTGEPHLLATERSCQRIRLEDCGHLLIRTPACPSAIKTALSYLQWCSHPAPKIRYHHKVGSR